MFTINATAETSVHGGQGSSTQERTRALRAIWPLRAVGDGSVAPPYLGERTCPLLGHRRRSLATGARHLSLTEHRHPHKSLWEWADHLNQLGNEGAHPEDYDDVTAKEAEGLGKFMRHLIRHEYEMPAQLLRDQGVLKDDEPDADEELHPARAVPTPRSMADSTLTASRSRHPGWTGRT